MGEGIECKPANNTTGNKTDWNNCLLFDETRRVGIVKIKKLQENTASLQYSKVEINK